MTDTADYKRHCCTRSGEFRACMKTLMAIVALVQENEGSFPTDSDIAERREISASTVSRHLKELLERGLLDKTLSGYMYVVGMSHVKPSNWSDIAQSPCHHGY